MQPIYELTNEFSSLISQAEKQSQQVFAHMLTSASTGDMPTDTYQYALLLEQIELKQQTIEKEYNRITDIRSRLKNAIVLLNKKIKDNMESCKVEQFNTDQCDYKIQRQGGRKALDIYDAVPDKYMKVVYEPDTDKIRAALDKGETLSFAKYKEKGMTLRIYPYKEKIHADEDQLKIDW